MIGARECAYTILGGALTDSLFVHGLEISVSRTVVAFTVVLSDFMMAYEAYIVTKRIVAIGKTFHSYIASKCLILVHLN